MTSGTYMSGTKKISPLLPHRPPPLFFSLPLSSSPRAWVNDNTERAPPPAPHGGSSTSGPVRRELHLRPHVKATTQQELHLPARKEPTSIHVRRRRRSGSSTSRHGGSPPPAACKGNGAVGAPPPDAEAGRPWPSGERKICPGVGELELRARRVWSGALGGSARGPPLPSAASAGELAHGRGGDLGGALVAAQIELRGQVRRRRVAPTRGEGKRRGAAGGTGWREEVR
jgi:hypothetical protein